jgi:acetyl esterase/lipase
MAQVTGLPVFAFDFDQEPVVPWPENIRSIFNFLEYALEHGPDGRERAERIFIVADSEGTLTALQVTASLLDNGFKEQMGYAQSTPLENPSQWLAGLVLSSPVVDVDCQTESFAYNIWNATTMSGDPDTGVGWDGYSLEDIIGDCRWSYIEYAYGLRGDWGVANDTDANEQFARNKGFYTKPLFDPINGGLKGFPPVYMVSGVRDFYYSDAPNLAYQLCMEGIEFEIYNAEGLFHDWWLYSNGCGVNGSIGPRGKIPESLVVDNQVAKFVRKHGSRPTLVVV